MAAQEEPPPGVEEAAPPPSAQEEAQAPPPEPWAEVFAEENAWLIEGIDTWQGLPAEEGVTEANLENQALRRYWDDVNLDEKGFRGFDARVDLYHPDVWGQRYPVPFCFALQYSYGWCVEVLTGVEDESHELKRVSNCIYQLVNLFAEFMQLRWNHVAFMGFQWMLDILLRPEGGLFVVLRDWVRSSPEDRPGRRAQIEGAIVKVVTASVNEIKEVLKHYVGTDPSLLAALIPRIDLCVLKIWSPGEEDLKPLPSLPRPRLDKEWSLLQLTRIMVEMRSAWSEPRFRKQRELIRAEPKDPDALQAVKAGRYGVFCRHYDILKKHGLEESSQGVKDLCGRLAEPAKHDRALRKIVQDITRLYSLEEVPEVAVAPEAFALGQRVWAFYDTYMHSKQWRYRYVHVGERPSAFPLTGTAAGWLQGTVVGRAETSGVALDGFAKVRVRFDGYFCDSRNLTRELDIKAGRPVDFPGGVRYFGRCVSENKEFMIPKTLLRDIGNPPPQPLLSVLNMRPCDYYTNPRLSDYNICNDGYVQDLFHGPCSMREQMPGEYEVVAVFVKDTADLERLDTDQLRARLTGRNVIGWYLQWPQVQSKSIWGNGSCRKQQFFAFCTRAERSRIPSGWPHASHVYELLAGKIWIPRMSLCRDFKVMPSANIDYAAFKRNPGRTIRQALLHIAHLRKVVWGYEETPYETFRGVAKFGYSWCGLDVTPFIGPEGLAKVCEAMFHKEGNEHTTIIIQEMLPNVVAEYRNLCFYDRLSDSYHREPIWVSQMKKGGVEVDGFSGMASSSVVPTEQVAVRCLSGDVEAQRCAEKEADRLCELLLRWARAESLTPLQCTRIDFLVAKGDEPGQAKVWTCEVGECGGSLCSVEVHARNTVALNNAVRDDPSGRFPVPLHRPVPRNDGQKSH